MIQWFLLTRPSSITLRATQVVWTQMLATWDMWYIDEGFLIWIILMTYQSRESIIWACTTDFVHTCIYHMFSISIACLVYLSHVYVYLCPLYRFHACFLIQIYWYTCIYLISDLLSFPIWLLIIACTYIPEPHYLIRYTCAWYAHYLALSYVLAGCIWQPWILMSRS